MPYGILGRVLNRRGSSPSMRLRTKDVFSSNASGVVTKNLGSVRRNSRKCAISPFHPDFRRTASISERIRRTSSRPVWCTCSALRCRDVSRELPEGLVKGTNYRVGHHLRFELLIDIDQCAAWRQVTCADTQTHQLNILQGITLEIVQPGDAILIILCVIKWHHLENIGKAEMKARTARDG